MGTVWYSPNQAIFISIFFCLIDIFINLLGLTWNGKGFSLANLEHWFNWANYEFTKNPVDFFYIGLVRCFLLLGGAVGVYFNSRTAAVACAKWSNFMFAILLLIIAFSPSKMLAFYENKDPQLVFGDWILMGWCVVASLAVQAIWSSVFCRTRDTASLTRREDRQRLIDGGEGDSDSEESDDNEQYFKSVQVEVEASEAKQKETMSMLVRLFGYMGKEGFHYTFAFLFLFLFALSKVFTPYYTGEVVASVIQKDAGYEALNRAVLIMAILSLAGALFGGLRGAMFTYAQARVDRRIRNDLFRSLVNQEIGFFDANKTGEICSRLNADCQTMSNTLSLYMNVFTRNVTMLIGSLIFMFSLSWRLSMVTFIAIPLIFFVSKVFGVYYDALSEETQDSIAHSNDVAEEVISSMRTVKSFACEKFEAARFLTFLDATLKIGVKKSIVIIGYIWVLEIFQMGILTAVLFYGGHLVLKNEITVGLLVSFMLYQFQLGENMRELSEVWNGLMQAVGASRKVFDMIDRNPVIRNNTGGFKGNGGGSTNAIIRTTPKLDPLKPTKGKIEFKDVRFSYPTRPTVSVLNSLSFTIEAGESVALVGPSGGGKSSIIALLEHFYEPLSGEVLIDGINIRDYNHKYLHRMVSLVGQNPVLYARSVKENIGYGLDEYTDDQVVTAAQMSNSHTFITDTPDQYETNCGERGSMFSGGQGQRLAIARSVILNPNIMLLDESTSALDTESEKIVQEAIDKNMKGKTVVAIAHRLSTIFNCDKIFVIDGGKVIQAGNHNELMKQDGMYKMLVNRQMTEQPSPLDTPAYPKPDSIAESSTTYGARSSRSRRIGVTSPQPPVSQSFLGTSFAASSLI